MNISTHIMITKMIMNMNKKKDTIFTDYTILKKISFWNIFWTRSLAIFLSFSRTFIGRIRPIRIR